MRSAGVLIIAHGSRNLKWNSLVEQVAQSVRMSIPIRVSYLEFVEGKSIKDGVRFLEQMGVKRIIVIPLFVTMGSTHLHEIQYMLGLTPSSLSSTEMEPIRSEAEIIWCSPLEDHELVYQILKDRVHGLTQNPCEEVLLLIGHGSDKPEFHERWEELLQRMAVGIRRRFGFKGVSYATLHPDKIERRAKALSRKNRLLVLPIFLSEGYFTNVAIPARLREVSCIYDGKTYLPHPLVVTWVEQTIIKELKSAEFMNKKLA